MKVENIHFENMARGFYTPAKKVDVGNAHLIFVSGIQHPLDEAGDVADTASQTLFVFQDIEQILNLAGAGLDDVIKAVIYVTDMNDFDIVSPIRAEYFKNSKPVSTLVEVSKTAQPGAKIEVEVTAIIEK